MSWFPQRCEKTNGDFIKEAMKLVLTAKCKYLTSAILGQFTQM